MNDNDIIKALEHCIDIGDCSTCTYTRCIDLPQDALDLIKRQKAEIKRLEAECEKQYEQATADILGNMADGGTSCHWCMAQHRAKAIKMFAGRLKERTMKYTEYDEGGWDCTIYCVKVEDIQSLVKEMTEEPKEDGHRETDI